MGFFCEGWRARRALACSLRLFATFIIFDFGVGTGDRVRGDGVVLSVDLWWIQALSPHVSDGPDRCPGHGTMRSPIPRAVVFNAGANQPYSVVKLE
jgi:hypothetical protein